jgi:hypothetical protein
MKGLTGQPSGWKQLTYAEYVERGLGRKTPKHGCMHLMAQSCSISWPERQPGSDFHELRRETILLPPIFVGATTASTLFQAIEDSVPLLKFEELLSIPAELIVLSLGGDLDGSNVRLKFEYKRRAALHNEEIRQGISDRAAGYVALVDVVCVGSDCDMHAAPRAVCTMRT